MASTAVGITSAISGGLSALAILTAPKPQVYTPLTSGWRPPQWSKPPVVSITVPAQPTTAYTGSVVANAGITNGGAPVYTPSITATTVMTSPLTYVFDAVLALDHEQALTKTQHPVQTGAAVTSHAYLEPSTLIMDILMSDASQAYTAASQTAAPYIQAWTGNASSKSVSAYQTMISLQAQRIPLTITTRLRTYYNMMIKRISPREDSKTITGLRMRVEFEQLFIAGTQVTPISARPNDTSSTGLGSVNPNVPSYTITTQYTVASGTGDASTPTNNLLDWTAANPSGVDVPGAGTMSSSPTTNLSNMAAP